jgi:thioesterase domain-containing protein
MQSALLDYLHLHIPLSRAMDVRVLEASADQVVLEAPLSPNGNMHGTMFGGSAATLALLAAWSVLHLRLEAGGIANQLVIHRTEMDYLRPITGKARATATLADTDWPGFVAMLNRRGKARLKVESVLTSDGVVAGRLAGAFVAILDR